MKCREADLSSFDSSAFLLTPGEDRYGDQQYKDRKRQSLHGRLPWCPERASAAAMLCHSGHRIDRACEWPAPTDPPMCTEDKHSMALHTLGLLWPGSNILAVMAEPMAGSAGEDLLGLTV